MRGIQRGKPAAFLDIISELFEFCVPHVLEREDIQSGIFVKALSHRLRQRLFAFSPFFHSLRESNCSTRTEIKAPKKKKTNNTTYQVLHVHSNMVLHTFAYIRTRCTQIRIHLARGETSLSFTYICTKNHTDSHIFI